MKAFAALHAFDDSPVTLATRWVQADSHCQKKSCTQFGVGAFKVGGGNVDLETLYSTLTRDVDKDNLSWHGVVVRRTLIAISAKAFGDTTKLIVSIT